MENLNEKITIALKRNHMTQKELAERANLTEASISRYVNGSREPMWRTAIQIADALNVSLDWLAGR